MNGCYVSFFPPWPHLPISPLIPNYSIMHNVGHKGTAHSNVSHHLQPYNGRLLALVCITTNATYDARQRTYNCGFILSVKRPSWCARLWTRAMFFFFFILQNICMLSCLYSSIQFNSISSCCIDQPPCLCEHVCLYTKEAVNLTMFAGRTSGCPIVHLGKQPVSNNIGLHSGGSFASGSRDPMHPPAAACRETPGNVGSHHSK